MNEALLTITIFVPFLLVYFLANIAQRQRENSQPHSTAARFSYAIIILLYVGAILAGFGIQAALSMMTQPDLIAQTERPPEVEDALAMLANVESPQLVGMGIWLPALLGLILLLPPIRRLIASFTNTDPENPVHAVTLPIAMVLLMQLLALMGVGLGNFAEMMEGQESSLATTLSSLWSQQITTAVLALVGVGWLTRRSWGEAMTRLGVVIPSGPQILIGVVTGLVMAPLVVGLFILSQNFGGEGLDSGVEDLTRQLLGPLFTSLFGIFTLGAAAALGEEFVFRGAMQPRFGLLLTTIVFTLAHANYGFSISTLVVFVVGLILGLIRIRFNTTTAMIVHAIYNMTLGFVEYMEWLNI